MGARYWRIYQNSNTRQNSNGYEWHLQNVGFFASTDGSGTNLATTSNTTASSPRGSEPIAYLLATSGSCYIFASYWAGEVITLDAGAGNKLDIRSARYRNAAGSSWAPTSVLVQWSADGSSWTTSKTYSDDGSTNQQVMANCTPAPSGPTSTTQAISGKTFNSFYGNGTITDVVGNNATIRGFAYKVGTSGDPTVADSEIHEDGDFGTGAFSLEITGLASGTNYRVRAYATNPDGTEYGATVQAETYPAQPSLTTEPATAISSTQITCNGTVTFVGAHDVTIRGFAYKEGTTGDPTIADNEVHEDGTFSAEEYSLDITGLAPETYYRVAAYATNSDGTAYGNTIQVSTDTENWLSGYTYRKAFTISRPSGELLGQQAQLLVYQGEDTGGTGMAGCGGRCAPDFDDIRFTTLESDKQVFLLTFEGADAATTWPELAQGLAFYFNNGLELDTAQFFAGSSSLRFPNTNTDTGYIIPGIAADFTFTTRYRYTGDGEENYPIWLGMTSGTNYNPRIEMYHSGGWVIKVYDREGNALVDGEFTSPPPADTWVTWKFVVSGRDVTLYIDDVEYDTWTATIDNPMLGVDQWLVGNYNTTAGYDFWLDGVEIKNDTNAELGFFIDSISGTTPNQIATVAIKIPNIYAYETKYYIYFGNPSATSGSNRKNVFFVSDDFERGADGDSIGGSWSVLYEHVHISTERSRTGTRSGKLVNQWNNPYYAEATFPIVAASDIKIRFHVYKVDGSGLNFGFGDNVHHIFMDWQADESVRWIANPGNWLNVFTAGGLTANAWHVLEFYGFNFSGNGTFSMSIDGTEVIASGNMCNHTDSDYDADNFLRLRDSQYSGGNHIWFDNVSVWKWAAVAPTWGKALDLQSPFPLLTTNAATTVTSWSCMANGDLTDLAGSAVTERGFCYKAGTSGDPTTADSTVHTHDAGFSTGAFSMLIDGLAASTGYRVRAYAINSDGAGYGLTVQVTTQAVAAPANYLQFRNRDRIRTKGVSLGLRVLADGSTSFLVDRLNRMRITGVSLEDAVIGVNPWNPTSISGCLAWHAADAIVGLNDGDDVGTWADLTGAGKDFTQGTAGAKPHFKTNIQNGKPALLFDGSNSVMNTGTLTDMKSICVVAYYTVGATFTDYDGLITGATSGIWMIGDSGGNGWYTGESSGMGWYKDGSYTNVGMAGAWHVFITTNSTGQNIALKLGSDRGMMRGWHGYVAEVAAYNVTLSAQNIADLTAYMRTKYGF